MAGERETVFLFSYGTLRQAGVQLATFGRRLDGRPDVLTGFALSPMTIVDPHVIEVSGMAVHTIARPTGNQADRIDGVVFEVSRAELDRADRYESGPIQRIAVRLASGVEVFVYVAADTQEKGAPA